MLGLTLDLPETLPDQKAARAMVHMAVDSVIDNLLNGQHVTIGVFKIGRAESGCNTWCCSMDIEPLQQPMLFPAALVRGVDLNAS